MVVGTKKLQIIRGLKSSGFRLDACALTIGNFDGMHLGHQQLLQQTVQMAEQMHLPSVVMTFDPHPSHILHPEKQIPRLMDIDEQARYLDQLGFDYFVVEPFTRDFSNSSSEEFLSHWLMAHLAPKAVIVGYDFSFGKDRSGTLTTLETWAKLNQIRLKVVEPVHHEHQVVSSTLIRKKLLDGDVQTAAIYLGHRYHLSGEVVRGDGRGKQIGVPTANLHPSEFRLIPGRGVYSGWCYFKQDKIKCAINIGVRPTFKDNETKDVVEVHLLDWQGNLYGEKIEVEFAEKLRDERRFASVEELVQQIRHDIGRARESL